VTGTTCPNCGEPVEPRQLVCLSCGGRIALRGRGSAALEPVSALAAVLVVVIVIGAAGFGYAMSELTSSDGGDGERPGAAATTPQQAGSEPEAPAVVGGSEQEAPAGEEELPAEEQPPAEPPAEEELPAEEQPPAEPPAARGVPTWPPDLRAHTVVLVTTSDRPAAIRVARGARSTGLEAGLMRSDPYDLGTGLWIVFSGQFTTLQGAQRQAAALGERYPGAYAQLVSRSQ
jgi:hypothetical protein